MRKVISSFYLSCPMNVDSSTLMSFVKLGASCLYNPANAHYWVRGTPYNTTEYTSMIINVDAFLIILPSNSFKHPLINLPSGTRSELNKAIAANKPLYLCYISKDGPKIYSASISDDGKMIEGVTGTHRNFKDDCTEGKKVITYREIAEAVGISHQSVKQYLTSLGSVKTGELLDRILMGEDVRIPTASTAAEYDIAVHTKQGKTSALQTTQVPARVLLLKRKH